MKYFWNVNPKMKIFDIFGNFHLYKSPERNYYFFLIYGQPSKTRKCNFQKKSSQKISTKIIESPYCTV